MAKRRSRETADNPNGKLYSILFSSLLGVISAIVFAAVFSFVINAADMAETAIGAGAYIAAAAGAFVCGFASGTKLQNKGLIWGLAAGAAMALLLYGCGVCVCGFGFIGNCAWVPIAVLAASGFGGVIGVNFR